MRSKKPERPARRIFRYGFDWMRQVVWPPDDKCASFPHLLTLLWNALTG